MNDSNNSGNDSAHMIIEEIATDRLRLAPLDPGNVNPRYPEWLNDPEVTRFLETRLDAQSLETARQYVISNNDSDNALLFGIFEKATDTHIGNIRISEISWQHKHGEVGLIIGEKSKWGKGYAQEAITALTDHAFQKLKLRKLVAGCYLSNVGSLQAFKRAGYIQVGRLQSHWNLGGRFDDQILLERNATTLSSGEGRLKDLQNASIEERMNAIQHALNDKRFSEGQRVFLRPLFPADVNDRYVSWFADGTVVSFLEARNVTRDAAIAYLLHGLESGEYFMCALCDRITGTHIGNVKLGPIAWNHGTSDLVTVIGDRTFWGRGLATEAINLGSRLMLEGIGLRKLHGAIYASNVGSVNAYTRGGWIVEGRLKDHVLHEGEPMDVVLVSCFLSSLNRV